MACGFLFYYSTLYGLTTVVRGSNNVKLFFPRAALKTFHSKVNIKLRANRATLLGQIESETAKDRVKKKNLIPCKTFVFHAIGEKSLWLPLNMKSILLCMGQKNVS